MLTAVIPIPQARSITIDRRMSVTEGHILNQIDPSQRNSFAGLDMNAPHQFVLGGQTTHLPPNVFKAVYVSYDGLYIFETVYVMDLGEAVVLYTKIIHSHTVIGISFVGTGQYRADHRRYIPLSLILSDINWMNRFQPEQSDIYSIVAPTYNRETLDQEVGILAHLEDGGFFRRESCRRWDALHRYEPVILEALLGGRYIRAPHHSLQSYHNGLDFKTIGHIRTDDIRYRMKTFKQNLHFNCDSFDSIALNLVELRPAEFIIQLSFTDALHGVFQTAITKRFIDPYHAVKPMNSHEEQTVINTLQSVFREALWEYSQIFDINIYDTERRNDTSFITISKNMNDEILFEFNDTVLRRNTAFYTSFPMLAIATLSAGYKLDHG